MKKITILILTALFLAKTDTFCSDCQVVPEKPKKCIDYGAQAEELENENRDLAATIELLRSECEMIRASLTPAQKALLQLEMAKEENK